MLLEGLPQVDLVLTWRRKDLTEPLVALRPVAWEAARPLRDPPGAQPGPVLLRALTSAVALLSGASRRIGYRDEAFPHSLTGTLPGEALRPSGVARGGLWGGPEDLRRASGSVPRGRPRRAPRCACVSHPRGREELRALLQPILDGAGAGRLVVLHPGATNGRAKQWPLPYWIDLILRLRGRGAHGGAQRGARRAPPGRGDITAGARKATGAGQGAPRTTCPHDPACPTSAERTSLPALLALLERADVMVSGDSGRCTWRWPDCPVLAIHGPTDPGQSGPYRARRALVLRHELPCSPLLTSSRWPIARWGTPLPAPGAAGKRFPRPAVAHGGGEDAPGPGTRLPARLRGGGADAGGGPPGVAGGRRCTPCPTSGRPLPLPSKRWTCAPTWVDRLPGALGWQRAYAMLQPLAFGAAGARRGYPALLRQLRGQGGARAGRAPPRYCFTPPGSSGARPAGSTAAASRRPPAGPAPSWSATCAGGTSAPRAGEPVHHPVTLRRRAHLRVYGAGREDPPPVDAAPPPPRPGTGVLPDVSRFEAYKRIDLAIQACRAVGAPLRIVGAGWTRLRLREVAGDTPHVRSLALSRTGRW